MRKVMLVEDEEFILHGIKNIIDWEALGLEIVHMAQNGKKALEMWEKEPVDIIITDLEMPEMGGLELLRMIRSKDTHTRFIILTGYDEFEYAREAIRLEVENYILKPINEDALEEQLKETIEKLDELEEKRITHIEEQSYWMKFLSGKQSDEEQKRYMEILGISEFDGRAYAAIMKIDPETSADEIKVTDVLKELAKEENMTVIPLASNTILMMKSGEIEKDYFVKLQNTIESRCGILSFLTVSGEFEKIQKLPEKYQEARKLQKYVVLDGYGSCITHEEILTRKNRDISVDSVQFRKMILKKDKEGAIGYLENLFINNIEEDVSLDVLYQIALKIAMLLQDIKVEYKLEETKGLRDFAELMDIIYQADNLFGLKSIFISEVIEIIDYLHEEDSQYTPVVKQIMNDVQRNYKEDMNLKTLAYKYHMNASYLGQIFQKEVGCSFAQYLSNTKNSMAKDLILNTNMKINDIAKEVGYPDTSYFYRKFKQCYGVSPASLREMKKY